MDQSYAAVWPDFTPPLTIKDSFDELQRISCSAENAIRIADMNSLVDNSDYAIYEGVLRDFVSHLPATCSTAGAVMMTITPAAGDRYYWLVPRTSGSEGSYGTDAAGAERPQSTAPCIDQAITVCD